MIRDFNIEWLEKRVWLPVAGLMLAEGITGPQALQTWVSATSKTRQVGTSAVTALATTAQNDGGSMAMLAPYDLDINHKIRFRVHFTQTADTGTVTWALTYKPIIAGTSTIAAPATALDVVIPAYTTALATDDVWLVTDFGEIARKTLLDTTDGLLLKLICTDAIPNAALALLGLEMRYTPRRTAGPRRNIIGGRRMVTIRPLGVQLAPAQEGL